MRTLLAVDEDSLFEDVLSSLRWCVRVGPDHEVTVLHATPVVAWMRRVAESSTTWAEYAREEDAKAERLLAHCADLLSSWGIAAETLRGEGHPAGEILRVARERAADLIVLGTRAHEERGFLVGSVSQKIKMLAETDVLLVRRGAPFGDSSFRAVLAVDGSEESLAAVESFARKTQTEEADVVLLHAVDLPRVSWGLDPDGDATDLESLTGPAREQAERAIHGAHAVLSSHDIAATIELRKGSPAPVILAAAERHRAHLVVLGSRGLTGLRRLPLGSVAQRVVRHAVASVLVGRGSVAEGPA